MTRNGKDKRRDVPLADESQKYARVTSMLGNNRVRAKFDDGIERLCRIRGSMRRREWVHVGDIVLVATRELAGDACDIVFRYLPSDVARLRRLGEPIDVAGEDEDDNAEYVTFEAPEPDPGPETNTDDEIDWDVL